MITAEVQEFVRRQRLGFVATVAPDGTPAVSPKGTTTVWDDSHLVFADIASPGTVHNLRANPAVQVNVVDVIVRRGYRFTGTAEVHDSGSLFERGVRLYAERGLAAAESRIRAIVVIAVAAVEPLWSPAYDVGQSEDDVREQWWSYWAAMYDATGPATPARRHAET